MQTISKDFQSSRIVINLFPKRFDKRPLNKAKKASTIIILSRCTKFESLY